MKLQRIQETLMQQITPLFFALLIATLVFYFYGVDAPQAFQEIFVDTFFTAFGVSETIVKAIPLMIVGLGLSIAFKAGIWNIGAEGQLIVGAIASTGVALFFSDYFPGATLLVVMFLGGFLAGSVWGIIGTVLKPKIDLYDAMATLMMNFVALLLLQYFVYGPWKGEQARGFPFTNVFVESAQLPRIADTRIHYPTLILAFGLVVVIYLLINRTKFGFEVRVIGDNPEAARYAGISPLKVLLIAIIISGGFAGIAGTGEVAGVQYRLRTGISPGYGYTAIVVAWLGRNHPIGIVIASLFVGGLLVGGDAIQVSLGLPFGIVNIFNGLILYFLGQEFLLKLRRKQW